MHSKLLWGRIPPTGFCKFEGVSVVRRFAVVVVTLFFYLFIIPSSALAGDFRMANWGDTLKRIKKIEKLAELRDFEDDYALFVGAVSGYETKIKYKFKNGRLVRGLYIFDEKHPKKLNLYLKDFKNLKNNLIKRYGKPKHNMEHWANKSFKHQPTEWGMAVRLGHLSLFTVWETPTTVIREALYGGNFKFNMVVTYESKKYIATRKMAKAEKIKRDKEYDKKVAKQKKDDDMKGL